MDGVVITPEWVLDECGDKDGPYGLYDADDNQLGRVRTFSQLDLLDHAYGIEGTYRLYYCDVCGEYVIMVQYFGWGPPCPNYHSYSRLS